MKKRMLALLLALVMVIAMFPMQAAAAEAETITPGDVKYVTVLEDQEVTYTFVPTETAEYTFWNASSDRTFYCHIYEDGSRIKQGNAHFAFVAKAGSTYEIKVFSRENVEAVFELHLEKNVPAEFVEMDNDKVVMIKGERKSFPLEFEPVNSIRGEYSWSISDETVVTFYDTFNSGCNVDAVGAGTATLSVTVGGVSASCEITVLDPDTMDKLNPGDTKTLDMEPGTEQWYSFQVTEADAYTFWHGTREELSYNSHLTCWRITNSGMSLIFSGNGIIPLNASAGETYVFRVRNPLNMPQPIRVNLAKNVPAESVTLRQSVVTLVAGSSNYTPVTPQFVPVNSDRSGMEWTLADPNVVQIVRAHQNACEIIPKQAGTTTLTGKIGDKTVSCKVQVVVPEVFNPGEVKTFEIEPGETKVFSFNPTETAQYTLWNAKGFNGYFFSLYEGSRQINNGNCPVAVDAYAGAPYMIHVRSENAETTTFELHLEKNVEMVSVSMDMEEMNIGKGGHAFVQLVYNPLNSIRGDVQWSIADTSVAVMGGRFDGGCNIEAVGLGTTTLTATVAGQSLTCTINVVCGHQQVENNVCQECGIKLGTCGDDLEWTLNNDGVLSIFGTGKMAEYDYRAIPWINYREDIKTVVVGDGVESICAYAFLECKNLQQVILPESVTEIGMAAFRYCTSLKTVDLPDGLTSIASNLFSACSGLESIVIPEGVTCIGESAFNGCASLKSIVIPANVTRMEKWAISGCVGMTEIVFKGSAPAITEDAFTWINATALYPAEDPTWTDAAKQNYGGNITWMAAECKDGHSWGDWSVKTEATATKDGVKVRTCTVCGASESKTIPATGVTENPFADVPETQFYFAPVQWAVANEVTTGLNATTFGPDEECTRSQIVTFLWRAAGKPEPKSSENPFTDVKSSDFYYKAVLWAVEQGITTGLNAKTFGPNETCTRGQVATFLHRYAGSPNPTGTNPFKDVEESAFYYKAVLWAVAEGVTTGLNARSFGPDQTCTRGQIVTFLYRAIAE